MKLRELGLISYLPSYEDVQTIINNKDEQILSYAYILHDKDVNLTDVYDNESGELLHAKGSPKEPHFHIYLRLSTDRDALQICRWFQRKDKSGRITANCFYKPIKKREGILNYLTHNTKDSKVKYQYDKSSVVMANCDNIAEDLPRDDSFDVINDILAGVRTYELVKKYGRDFIYHYKQFQDVAQAIVEEQSINNFHQELKAFGDLIPVDEKETTIQTKLEEI